MRILILMIITRNTGWFIYDDIMWWTVTLARAYELFAGVEEYLVSFLKKALAVYGMAQRR